MSGEYSTTPVTPISAPWMVSRYEEAYTLMRRRRLPGYLDMLCKIYVAEDSIEKLQTHLNFAFNSRPESHIPGDALWVVGLLRSQQKGGTLHAGVPTRANLNSRGMPSTTNSKQCYLWIPRLIIRAGKAKWP